ncbi:MAG TPA: HEAT repeat domain-containing protein [Gemmatimonadaceae bacterium]|nr:HEAT repeat domain-containing protein [Gemmatimonadaceae bacterium]
MTRRLPLLALALAASTVALPSHGLAQNLASRIASSQDRAVTFSYPARPGVCGDGRTYISTSDNFVGSYSTTTSYERCQAGPVRVVIDLADRTVIALRTFVGGATTEAGVTNLGTVSSADAADYLVGVAARADGRVGKDAIFAASLGENVELSGKVLEIARDASRPLETRTAALSALRRSDARQMDRIGAALIQIARNEDDAQRVRSHALSVLGRLDHGGGIQPLIQMASSNSTSWIARESMRALSRSGDPRARQFLRTAVQRTDLPDELLAIAIGGLGGSYVTGQDAALLRSIYPRLSGREAQNKVMSALANLGGSENVQWLMGIVRDERQPVEARRRALQHASRAGVTIPTLVALYDGTEDNQMRQSLIALYGRDPTKAGTDKLVWIARNEQNPALRRRAISALSKNSDPAVRQALQAIVER